MRPTVAVVTDSTPYLSRGLIDRWGICEVNLYVGWDGDLRPEDEYRDLDTFYARLRESPTLPATSQPSGTFSPATSRSSLRGATSSPST
jgi:fatty acid-binding protein DegV